MTDVPRTLRELCRLIEADNPRSLDALLAFDVRDWREHVATGYVPASLDECSRSLNPPYLRLSIYVDHEFRLQRKRVVESRGNSKAGK